ncbi:hypothetical protein CcaverHIS002_0100560 [Cutaneotrichosporon cavernicola]|uniref:Uncharacterized protein n=1 Tax=Cutaneotrichosporon cavernicola TaxID=279322 RepID=A0AA48KZT7_9TREE|nr:uncharacterized protein CcaverHIS019_0100530 [Cutaneotrichosporon cavernicola]BEI79527.1 hypothetical protein CcaverHIS002_0100560 [Cutaneotrichosporon cavernicola]BEI87335.1 hypothetical protein CcaverHIS019_0100530 [Cutaneotrichosporon cavernicola]
MLPRPNKESKTANLIQQYEDRLYSQNEKRSKKIIDEATEFYDELVKDYSVARGGGELQAQCQARFAQLVANLETQDNIIADAYIAIEKYSSDTERVMAKEVELVRAELDRSMAESTTAKAGIQKAQALEHSTLSAVDITASVRL